MPSESYWLSAMMILFLLNVIANQREERRRAQHLSTIRKVVIDTYTQLVREEAENKKFDRDEPAKKPGTNQPRRDL